MRVGDLMLIKDCPNHECEHFDKGDSHICFSCGWLEAKHYYTKIKDKLNHPHDRTLKKDGYYDCV